VPGKKGGSAHFHMHEDNCNQQPEKEDFSDASSGTDFHSTHVTSVTYDKGLHNVTVVGSGTNNGVSVTFTIVAVDSSLVPPGSFSITLSDGYSNSGNLLSGSITLH
jgi:3D (Asp-Asp-Asp) domain-containing protein